MDSIAVMTTDRIRAAQLILVTALSLSIGWGIRGNFGHEYGAMIPGALATMGAVLLSGRRDWWPRVSCFGFLGALGWSFGGSMSYMQVIAYTHSGHSPSVLYGFTCLFCIGALWGALGGAGAALPAQLSRDELHAFLAPVTTVFAAWILQDVVVGWIERPEGQFRHASPLYWFDTDWLAALTAPVAVLGLAAIRRRVDLASSLILHLAVGWWLCFLGLVVLLDWRMTPPRGDNWAGCLGMVLGLIAFLRRQRWTSVALASLVTGFIGGFGFATATMLKLVEVKSGWTANWHSILEQTYGFINGVGLGVALLLVSQRERQLTTEPSLTRATRIYSVAFVLLVITYVNLSKNPPVWVAAKSMPAVLYSLSAEAWFNIAYALLALMVLALLVRHTRSRLNVISESSLGRGQLLYLIFLWWMIVGNLERALVSFTAQRLATEGVLHVNAAICTLLVLLWPAKTAPARSVQPTETQPLFRRLAVAGLIGAGLTVMADWGVVRTLYGNQFAGHAALHIRFGPNATASGAKPKPDRPHP